jgi:hypothetical protein
MATNYIPFYNGKSAPEVPILGLLAVLSNYEIERLWPECVKGLQGLGWVLNELVRFAVTAYWPVVAGCLPEAAKLVLLLLHAVPCLWHFLGFVPGSGIMANLLAHL